LFWRAASVRSIANFSSALYLDSAVGLSVVEPLLLDPELLEDARRVALALVRHRDQEVLDADVLVLQPLGLGVRRFQQPHDARRRVDLHHVVRELRRRLQRAPDGLPQLRAVDTQLLEDLGRDPLLVVHQRHQDVLHVPLRVPVLPHHLLRRRQHLLRALCKPVLSHHDCVSFVVLDASLLAAAASKTFSRNSANCS